MHAKDDFLVEGQAKQQEKLAVSLKNLHFRWPKASEDILVIDDFSMKVGEMVFISGPSGCGKSTLLGIIAGILTPSSGSVFVHGSPVHTLESAQRDRYRGDHIGFIFQQFNLVPYLSIVENVLIPCRFSTIRAERAKRDGSLKAVAEDLLKRLDLAPALRGKAVNQLSIGQQQRVAAARALIGQPELLIADEPTSALDADRREAFLRLLLDECHACGTSLLFVSHDTALAEAFPRIVRMADLNKVKGEAYS